MATFQLPQTMVDALRAERASVVPFIGAGLAIPAGVQGLPSSLRNIAGMSDSAADDEEDLLGLVARLASELGTPAVQQMVARAVDGMDVRPTPALELLVRCGSGIVATFNYDDAIERAAESVGLRPRPLLPGSAEPYREPRVGELSVLHLHGAARNPESVVLPGATTERLNADSSFMTLLRALWARYQVLYLGFRFGPAESHLRSALAWLAASLPDASPQFLMVPASEVAARGEELSALSVNPLLNLVAYPDTTDHAAVHYAALLVAPSNQPAGDHLEKRAPRPVNFYLPPSLRTEETEASATAAEQGPGRLNSALLGSLILSGWVVEGELVEVDGLLAGLAAAGPALEDRLH